MGSVIDELSKFAGKHNDFTKYNEPVANFKDRLDGFLYSTMDEVRLWLATDFTRSVLQIIDLDDLEYLREGVLKREATGTITYQSQRDHSAHTLYNWLIGWYIYANSTYFRKEVIRHIKARGWPNASLGVGEFFGHVWQYTSLLHDIGYLFEGSLLALDPQTQSAQAHVGVRIVKDYFESRLWLECGLSSMHERRLLLKICEIEPPIFQYGQSMARIADTLRDLGGLGNLTKAVVKDLEKVGVTIKWPASFHREGMPGDAFDLWRVHYKEYGQKKAARRMELVRDAFEVFIYKEIPGAGVRLLDHAVCSGLLLLLVCTFYYRLRYAAEYAHPKAGEEERVLKKFVSRHTLYDYDPIFWWTGIVWATGAVAMHNVQQMKRPWTTVGNAGLLSIREDPLAFLGILVDCLEEWDRYSVFPVPAKLPVQAVDVDLCAKAGKVTLDYGEKYRAKKVRESLDTALKDWQKIVALKP